MGKTWAQKFDNGRQPVVVTLQKPFCGAEAGSKLFIATPRVVKQYIDAIPSGQSTTIGRMRDDLAREWNADASCPMTTSMFVRIVAEAALDELAAGKPDTEITPFWRVVEETGTIAQKLSAGPAFIRKMREREGIAPHPTDKRTSAAKLERYRHAPVRTRPSHSPQPTR
jgi:alkylated DNA nucleotide flippase Atl1